MYLYSVRQFITNPIAYKRIGIPFVFLSILLVSILFQFIAGNIALRYFAFPMNVIIALILLFLLWTGRTKWWVKASAGLSNSLFVMGLMAVCGLILGLFPQLSPQDIAPRNLLANRLGFYEFTTAIPFIVSLFIFLWVLGSVIVNRLKVFSLSNIGFALPHFGLWLAVFAGTFGSADTYKVKMAAYRDKGSRMAYEQSGNSFHFPYEIRLDDFDVIRSGVEEINQPGYIRNYKATISVLKNETETTFPLQVNHPVDFEGDLIYLSGYDMRSGDFPRYCIVQVVRQPWGKLTFTGILLMILGFGYLFITGFRAKKTASQI